MSTRQATGLRPSALKARKLHVTTDCLLTGLLGCVRIVTSSQPEVGFSMGKRIKRIAEEMMTDEMAKVWFFN